MPVIRSSRLKSLMLCGAACLTLGACGFAGITPFRDDVAARVATPAWMIERQIPAGSFNLTAFERMHKRGQLATLYIEGDGKGNSHKKIGFFNPTPTNPVALHLASKDKSVNLAYLARPCQYSGMTDPAAECDDDRWKSASSLQSVLDSYHRAMDEMKQRYGLTGFRIVGYDTGATLAAMLAASRRDAVSLRTVAGRFDLAQLEPYRDALIGMPQHHFAGGQDETSPPAEIHRYLQFLGPNECTAHSFIQEASHDRGWVDKWPELLDQKVPVCVAPSPAFVPIERPEPIFYPRMKGGKK